jgi:hypothetical protein
LANGEWRIANSESGKPRHRRAFRSLFAIRYSLFALFLTAAPAAAIDCAPYCDFTHDYGPYDLSWKRPGRYAFPVCAPNGECAPHAAHVYSRVSGWRWLGYWPWPERGVYITVRPRKR